MHTIETGYQEREIFEGLFNSKSVDRRPCKPKSYDFAHSISALRKNHTKDPIYHPHTQQQQKEAMFNSNKTQLMVAYACILHSKVYFNFL